MNVLDLFSGLGGWSAAFKDRGHSVTTLDIEPKFKPDIVKDILEVKSIAELGEFDIILASPPCTAFSVAAFPQHYWKKEGEKYYAASSTAELGKRIAKHTFNLLESSNAKFYIIENPRGLMRKVIKMPNANITYCQYGASIMKPTDLWGKLPPSFPIKSCKNRDKCHQAAPRGANTGTQGINENAYKHNKFAYLVSGGGGQSKYRALIPYGVSLAMCLACERDMGD